MFTDWESVSIRGIGVHPCSAWTDCQVDDFQS